MVGGLISCCCKCQHSEDTPKTVTSTRLPGFHSFLVVVELPSGLLEFSVRYSRPLLLLIGSRMPRPIRVGGTAVAAARAGQGVCLVDLPYLNPPILPAFG